MFQDGGEHFQLEVSLKEYNCRHYCHCKVTPAEKDIAISKTGKLFEYLSFTDEFDLFETEAGEWAELESGISDFSETIGRVIESQIKQWYQ